MASEVRMGQQGRVVIPASLRRELGIEPGDVLVVRAEGGRMVLEPRESVLRDLHGMFASEREGGVDEFLAWRRQEWAREEAELKGHE